MTDVHMRLEPCSDGVLSWLAATPVPYPDLVGQISDGEIAGIETVEIATEEYL
ncbi:MULTISPECIES: hypothetical protein [Streptomyces]|uniref:hypothetical protein n=1 Tax=Streptomyces TaxID=1883 RepID=UPI00142DC127|nr:MULTISPECIES: hypothetical protein [Streptomyces]